MSGSKTLAGRYRREISRAYVDFTSSLFTTRGKTKIVGSDEGEGDDYDKHV